MQYFLLDIKNIFYFGSLRSVKQKIRKKKKAVRIKHRQADVRHVGLPVSGC